MHGCINHINIHVEYLYIISFRFRPLRLHWCMRYESKNAQLKGFMSRSYKNVPLTVAIHHPQWMCYQLLTRPGQVASNFLYAGDIIMSGKIMYIRIYMCAIAWTYTESNKVLHLKKSLAM